LKERWFKPLPPRRHAVMDGRGKERNAMAPAFELAELRDDITEAVEIVPPHWLDDDEIIELEGRHELLLFERFADGTLLVTPPAGWKSDAGNTHAASIPWTARPSCPDSCSTSPPSETFVSQGTCWGT